MKKCCVLVSGTNGVGKSTLARAFIEHFGGVVRYEGQVSFTRDGPALVGPYNCSSGGVDRLKDERGQTSTKPLASVVEYALKSADVVLCEGVFLHTFGINMTNAIFKAERQLVVNLCAPLDTIYARLMARTGNRNRHWDTIAAKQRGAANAAERFHQIGVPVMRFDTSRTSTDEILGKILLFLETGN